MENYADEMCLTRKLPGKSLSKALLCWILLIFSLILLQVADVRADDETEGQMRKLVSEAGPVPDAIINPPRPSTNEVGAVEQLSRFWKEKIMGFRITYSTARGKACQANQRVLASAVEMFNMDKGYIMTRLIPADAFDSASPLVSGMYLKGPVTPPETNCEYMSYGDLTSTGIIYCSQHGTLPIFRTALIKVTGVKPNSAAAEERLHVAFVGLLVFLSLSTVMLLALLFKKKKPTGQEE